MEYKRLYFDPKEHLYFNEDGALYISATQLIHKYQKPFDVDYWAKKEALKTGKSVDAVKSEWKIVNKIACDYGNVKHNFLEGGIKNMSPSDVFSLQASSDVVEIFDSEVDGGYNTLSEELQREYPDLCELLQGYYNKGWVSYTEMRRFLHDYFVAGTIDHPIMNHETKEFEIWDWKTNKDGLKFQAGYYKKYKGVKTDEFIVTNDRLLTPLNHLPDCKGFIYTIQVSLYAYMLEQKTGYKCTGIKLFHVREGIKLFHIEYRKKEVIDMLNHYTNKVSFKKIRI